MKRWGLFLFGAGIGVVVGVWFGEPATLPALVAIVLGLFLLARGARSGELVGDALAAAGDAKAPRDRPSLAGLGSRVEQILSLAEQQAADTVAHANVKAAQIVAEAQAEADRLKPE